MGIFQWRGRVSKREFRKQLVESLRAEAPQLIYTLSELDALEFTISDLPDGNQSIVSLHRAYEEFEQDPATRADVLARWKRMLLRQASRAPLDPANVVPMVKGRGWLDEQIARGATRSAEGVDDSFWVEDYNEQLLVVYAEHREGFSYGPRGDYTAAGIRPQDIRALALRNLRERTPKREFSVVNGVWMINAGGNFEAALLLDEEIWNNHRFRKAEQVFAAVPERDTLLAGTDGTPTGVWNLAAMAAHIHRGEPYPVSPHLMIRRDGRFDLLDPRDEDPLHPIPNTTVIDVHAVRKEGGSRMVVIIATPMDADPRSIYRLYRKLDGHLEFMKTAEYREQCGAGETEIEVHVHPGSDAALFELLDSLPGYVERRGARLTVSELE